MRRNDEYKQNESQDTFERDETQLNQQDSEPTPTLALGIFGQKKKKSANMNMVAPYNPDKLDIDDLDNGNKNLKATKLSAQLGSRYKFDNNNFDEDDDQICNDYSRDDYNLDANLEEDIGIGGLNEDVDDDDDDRLDNILFDQEDLFGKKNERKALKQNRSKMMLDELEGGAGGHHETENSFR